MLENPARLFLDVRLDTIEFLKFLYGDIKAGDRRCERCLGPETGWMHDQIEKLQTSLTDKLPLT